jgi:hypothetical protein
VDAKALSTFMGHANIALTMDLYGHLMPGSEAVAADLLDACDLANGALDRTVAEKSVWSERAGFVQLAPSTPL